MTIAEFEDMILQMAKNRIGLVANCDYLQQKSRSDKYLREEYIAIQSVVRYKRYSVAKEIELGDEKQSWDARVAGRDIFEVVQALPDDEHEIRKAIALGQAQIILPIDNPEGGELDKLPLTGPAALFLLQAQHSRDHSQFPNAIINSINEKNRKNYPDLRTLIVVSDGDYSYEDDRIIFDWIEDIRTQTTCGTFKAIYLVERDRQKVFPLFE